MSSKTKEVLTEMLTDRGYVITDNSVDDKLIAQDQTSQLIVLISQVDKLNINIIKEYIKLIEELKIPKCIIVYNNCITASAKKVIQNLYHINIEVFNENELQYNITHHKYVKPHIKIEGDEFDKINTKYGKNLPILLSSDPVSRYYNFKKGDIIKIIRKHDIVAYRVVR